MQDHVRLGGPIGQAHQEPGGGHVDELRPGELEVNLTGAWRQVRYRAARDRHRDQVGLAGEPQPVLPARELIVSQPADGQAGNWPPCVDDLIDDRCTATPNTTMRSM